MGVARKTKTGSKSRGTIASRRAVLQGVIAPAVLLAGPAGAVTSSASTPSPSRPSLSAEDPVLVVYNRIRKIVAYLERGGGTPAERDAARRVIPDLDEALLTTPATSPLGVAAKIKELCDHMGWDAQCDDYEARICVSAITDLHRMAEADHHD